MGRDRITQRRELLLKQLYLEFHKNVFITELKGTLNKAQNQKGFQAGGFDSRSVVCAHTQYFS